MSTARPGAITYYKDKRDIPQPPGPRVRIFGQEYAIEYFEPHTPNDAATGRAMMAAGKIRLANNMPRDQTEETLLHEVVHIVADMTNVDLTEAQVSAISLGLFTAGIRVPR